VQCALYIQTAENQNNAIKNIEDVAGLGPWIHNNKCLFRSTNLILGTHFFLNWKGLHLISHQFKNESQTYYEIFFFADKLTKWPTRNSLFVRYCGFLSWGRIYFQGCHWSIQFTNYIPALSLEKTMYGYPKREKKSGLRTKIKSFHSGYLD